MSHMFVPILTDMFNHWFAKGAIPGSITKGAITLLQKGSRHVSKELDNYRPITLLNTEINILVWVLANRLVVSDLVGLEQNYAVKGRSTQDNLHLVCGNRLEEGIEDALISLDQFKAFDSVDHRFLMAVLENARSEPEFRRWIRILYRSDTGERKALGLLRNCAVGPAGLPPVSSSIRPCLGALAQYA